MIFHKVMNLWQPTKHSNPDIHIQQFAAKTEVNLNARACEMEAVPRQPSY